MKLTDPKDFEIQGHTFTLGVNTLAEERGRSVLIRDRDRYMYGGTFDSELARKSVIEALDPFYSDFVGSLRAVDGNKQHPLLQEFIFNVSAWENFYWEVAADFTQLQKLITATLWAQEQHNWYPKPQVTDAEDTEAADVISRTLQAIDPENTADVDQPDSYEIGEAVKRRFEIAAENRGEDFLE